MFCVGVFVGHRLSLRDRAGNPKSARRGRDPVCGSRGTLGGTGVALTKMQTLILWALLAKTGASPLKDIKPDVKKSERDALVRTGLVAEEKRGRELWLTITDEGWEWAADHLDADLPTQATGACIILRDWLTRLKAFMDASGLVLPDVL